MWRGKVYLIVFAVCLLLSPWLLYKNWYSILNSVAPFTTLDNKVAVDGVDIADYSERAEIDEIYIVDTLTGAIRQLTADSFQDSYPNISSQDRRIYFLSNRLVTDDRPHDSANKSLFYYDLSDQTIRLGNPLIDKILADSSGQITQLMIKDNLIAIAECFDGSNLMKLGDLGSNQLLGTYSVANNSLIVNIQDGRILVRENGQVRALTEK